MEVEVHHLLESLVVGDVVHVVEEAAARAPDGMRDHHRGEHARRRGGVHRTELAALDAAADERREHRHAALDHLARVELGQVGELEELPVHEAVDDLERRRTEVVPPVAHSALEDVAHGAALLGERLLGALDVSQRALADDRPKELFLVREVEVDGPLGDAGAPGDVLELGACQAALAEHLEGGVEDLARPLLGESAPAGLGFRGLSRHSEYMTEWSTIAVIDWLVNRG